MKSMIKKLMAILALGFAGTAMAATVDCSTWAEVKANLEAGNSVKLTQDVAQGSENGAAIGGQTVTLDLNGFKITGSDQTAETYRLFTLTGGTALTLTDGSALQTGTIDGNNVARSGNGGCVSVDSGATFTMNGGTITNCTAQCGGAVYNAGTTIISNGTITACSTSWATMDYAKGGGAIYNAGTLTVEDAIMSGNKALGYADGAVFYAAVGGTITVNGGLFANNTAAHLGGFCYGPGNGGTVIINGGEITANTSAYDTLDGGITLTVTGGSIHDNICTTRDYVIYLNTSGIPTITGGYIAGNIVDATGTKFNGRISGGVFDRALTADFVASGYSCIKVGSKYIVGVTPAMDSDGRLTGGTYTFCPTNAEYAAAGISLADDATLTGSGTSWTITSPNLVEVSDWLQMKYNLEAGNSVKVMKDISATAEHVFPHATKNVTIDLNGCVVTQCPNNYMFSLITDGTGTMTIKDSSAAGTGAFVGSGTTTGGDGGNWVRLYSSGRGVILESGTIRNFTLNSSTYGGGAIKVFSGATFMMYGGTISNCVAMSSSAGGGAVYVAGGGRFVQTNGLITCCRSTGAWGGAVGVVGASGNPGMYELSGGALVGNTSAMFGGAVFVGQNGTMTFTDGVISNNTANGTIGGGGICSSGQVTMKGGLLVNNKSAGNANSTAFYSNVDDSDVIYGGVIEGTIYREQTADLYIYGGVFDRNQTALASGYTCTKVGSKYVVGAGVASDANNKLTAGTYTFCPTNAEYAAAGLALADGYMTGKQSATPPTWIVGEHVHCICGTDTCSVGGHVHSALAWTGWTSTTSLPTDAGNWYLANDVTLTDKYQTDVDGLNICLNGHTIRQTSANNVINVYSSSGTKTVRVTDCGTTGKITGGRAPKYGGGVYASTKDGTAKFELYGGCICDNEARSSGAGDTAQGGGVAADGTSCFYMYGGCISNNTAYGTVSNSGNGGGVSAMGSGTVTLYGGEICCNYASRWGGGICTSCDHFSIKGPVRIYGNSATAGGGLSADGAVTAEGAEIFGNSATAKPSDVSMGVSGAHAGVVLDTKGDSSFKNCKIYNNTALQLSGGVVFESGSESLTLSETVVITNNTAGGAAANLYFTSGKKVTLSSLASDSKIGVTLASPPTTMGAKTAFTTNGSSSDTAYFVSDNAKYNVIYDTDHLAIENPILYVEVQEPNPMPANTTFKVYTNGVEVAKSGDKYLVVTNSANVKVVFKADDDYYFDDGSTAKTNSVNAAKNPAEIEGTIPSAPARKDYYVSASGSDANSGSPTAPFATITNAIVKSAGRKTTIHVMTDLVQDPIPFRTLSMTNTTDITITSDDNDPATTDDQFTIYPSKNGSRWFWELGGGAYMFHAGLSLTNIVFDGRIGGSSGTSQYSCGGVYVFGGGNLRLQDGFVIRNFTTATGNEVRSIVEKQYGTLYVEAGSLLTNNTIRAGKSSYPTNPQSVINVGGQGSVGAPNGVLRMTGGLISGNTATGTASAMINLGTTIKAYLTGGVISNNVLYASNSYACYKRMQNATTANDSDYYFGGAVVVCDNKDTNGKQKNVHIPSGSTAHLSAALTGDAKIGLYIVGDVTGELCVADGADYTPATGDTAHIAMDRDANFHVFLKDADKKIYIARHSWTYAVDAGHTDTLYAYCPFSGCPHSGSASDLSKAISIKLVTPDAEAGTPYAGAYLEGTNVWFEAGLTNPPLSYATSGSSSYVPIAPSDAGDYLAKATISNALYATSTFSLTSNVVFVEVKEPDPPIANTVFHVYTNGVEMLPVGGPYLVPSNSTDVVAVFTPTDGYTFPDGTMAKTNTVDASTNPATIKGTLPTAPVLGVVKVTTASSTIYYETLAPAFASIGVGGTGTVTMMRDLTLAETGAAWVPDDSDVTFDLNGKKVDWTTSKGDSLIYFAEGTDGKLKIKDSASGGTIVSTCTSTEVTNSAIVVYCDGDGDLTVEGGTFVCSNKIGAASLFFKDGNGDWAFSGGTYKAVSEGTGNADFLYLCAATGTTVVTGGDFDITATSAVASGVGASAASKEKVTITGGDFDIVSAGAWYGAFTAGNGTLIAKGGDFNVVSTGAGVSCFTAERNGTTIISNGTFYAESKGAYAYAASACATGNLVIAGGALSAKAASGTCATVIGKNASTVTITQSPTINLPTGSGWNLSVQTIGGYLDFTGYTGANLDRFAVDKDGVFGDSYVKGDFAKVANGVIFDGFFSTRPENGWVQNGKYPLHNTNAATRVAYPWTVGLVVNYTPPVVPNTTATVCTNGVPMEVTDPYILPTNVTDVTVIYTANPGYTFPDGTTAKTNGVDTTVNPATTKGTLPIAPVAPVASVTTNGVTTLYGDIGSAWDDANFGAVVTPTKLTLLTNITLTSSLSIGILPSNPLTFNLNDKILMADESFDRPLFVGPPYGLKSFAIVDEASVKTPKYFVVETDGCWTLTDVATDLSVTGGVVTAAKAGAVTVKYMSLTLRDVSFVGNRIGGDGGAALNGTGDASINAYGCRFFGNVSEKTGGAIRATETGVLLKGCEVAENLAGTDGGGIWTDTKFVLLDTVVTDNQAGTAGETANGGGVYYKSAGDCLAAGTMIRMADGTEKAIEDIAEGELVRTFDHEGGTNSTACVYYAHKGARKAVPFTLEFEGEGGAAGVRALPIVDCHDLLEQGLRKYVTITPSNVGQYIGAKFYGADGAWHTLIGVTAGTESVEFYSLHTAEHQNLYANGLLTVADDVDYLLNIYELDANLKADAAQLAADVAQYGCLSFEEAATCGMNRDWYDAAGAKYLNVAVGKQLVSREYAERLFESCGGGAAGVHVLPPMAVAPMMLLGATAEPTVGDFTDDVLTLGGSAAVTNNFVGANPNNIYLKGNRHIELAADHGGVQAGVTRENGVGQFTTTENVSSADVTLFTSDDSAYTVRYHADGYLRLALLSTVTPTPVDNTTFTIYTNGVPITESSITVPDDVVVEVVYTTDDGYTFPDGTTAKTNAVDVTVNPAEILGDLPPVPVIFVELREPQPLPANTTFKVYTNGVEMTMIGDRYLILSNSTDVVGVFKADDGYYFGDGTTEKTNTVNAAKNPAVIEGTIPSAPVHHEHGGIIFTRAIGSIADLEALCASGGTGYLTADLEMPQGVVITVGADVKLCLDGYAFASGSGAGSSFTGANTLSYYDCTNGVSQLVTGNIDWPHFRIEGPGTFTDEADPTILSTTNGYHAFDNGNSTWSAVLAWPVVFDAQGGTGAVMTNFVKRGEAIAKPSPDPVKADKAFDGWYTNAACTADAAWDFATPVTGELALYAKWAEPGALVENEDGDLVPAKDFTTAVTNVLEGGLVVSPNETPTLVVDKELVIATDDVDNFANVTADPTEDLVKTNSVGSPDSLVIIGKRVDGMVTVIRDRKADVKEEATPAGVEEDDWSVLTNLASSVQQSGICEALTVAAKANFVKLATEAVAEPEAVVVTVNLKVTPKDVKKNGARFIKYSYDAQPVATIVAVKNGDRTTVAEGVELEVGSDFVKGVWFQVQLPSVGMKPVSVMHKFSDGSFKEYVKGDGACPTALKPELTFAHDAVNGRVTFWTQENSEFSVLAVPPVQKTITYDAMGGVFEGGADAVTITQLDIETYAFPAAPTREGYDFVGWFDGVTNGAPQIVEGQTISETGLFAKWTLAGGSTLPDGSLTGGVTGDGLAYTNVVPTDVLAASGITDLVIPDMLDGKAVVEIGRNAFRAKSAGGAYTGVVTSVKLGGYVQYVRPYAFYGQPVTSVTFAVAHDYLTGAKTTLYVQDRAFEGTDLKTLKIPAGGIYDFSQNAFSGIGAVEDVYLYGSLTTRSLKLAPFRNIGKNLTGGAKVKFHLSPAQAADAAYVAALTNGMGNAAIQLDQKVLGSVNYSALILLDDRIKLEFTPSADSPWKTVNADTVYLLYAETPSEVVVGTGNVRRPLDVTRLVGGNYLAIFEKPAISSDKLFLRVCIGE